MLVDDRVVRSCLLLAVQVDGRSVRTIEGLAGPGEPLTPVQQAFHEHHGLQCGFCTPGFVMGLTSLAEQGRPISEAELDDCLAASYCRCTGYVNIRRAARQAVGLDPSGVGSADG